MKQISDKDIISYLLSMYPQENGESSPKIEEDVEKDLSNIMTEHYNKKKNRISMFWAFIVMLFIVMAVLLIFKRS